MTLATSCSDAELVAAVRRGSDGAFEELYSRYCSRIRAYVRGRVADHARAEDVTQEVFISALRRLRGSDSALAFKPWIYEIAKNACIDEYRRTHRRRLEVSLEVEPVTEIASRRRTLASPSAEVAAEEKQRLIDLQGAFGMLSPHHHQVIVLRELEGLSYSQIADRLGISRPRVESTLFRARRRLGEEYDELRSGRRCAGVQSLVDDDEATGVATSLGLRQRRRLARHLAHCVDCRRVARQAGWDDSFFEVPSVTAKIAALWPLPLLRWARGGGKSAAAPNPRFSMALRPLHSVTPLIDPTGPLGGVGRDLLAAAGTAVLLAGTGAALGGGPGSAHPAAPAHRAPAALVQPSLVAARGWPRLGLRSWVGALPLGAGQALPGSSTRPGNLRLVPGRPEAARRHWVYGSEPGQAPPPPAGAPTRGASVGESGGTAGPATSEGAGSGLAVPDTDGAGTRSMLSTPVLSRTTQVPGASQPGMPQAPTGYSQPPSIAPGAASSPDATGAAPAAHAPGSASAADSAQSGIRAAPGAPPAGAGH